MNQTKTQSATNGERVIFVTHIEWYGKETFRPQCEISEKFAQLLGQKTLTRENLIVIKEIGYEIRTKEVKI